MTISKNNKAKIIVLDKDGKEQKTIHVLFNPNKYTLSKSVNIKDHAINNEDEPTLQYLNGEAQKLAMELFFDTWHNRTAKDKAVEDVRKYTDEIRDLLYIKSDDHQPPYCLISWGSLIFKGYMADLSEEYTMFTNEGIPVRANLSVNFIGVHTLKEQMKRASKQSADRTKERTIKEGEQLFAISQREYGTPDNWRLIAKENNINNPRKLKTGQKIVIPSVE